MKNSATFMLAIIFVLSFELLVFAENFQGVNYTVIEKTNFGSVKGSIDIRLSKKVTRNFLQKLALNLREAEPRKYDRLFIAYYLPGMTPGSGAWATSHFNPNLEVKILGISIEEETALTSSSNTSGEVIGEWLDESPYLGSKFTLMKENGKITMMRKFKDGSSSEKEMIQKNQAGGLRFEEKKRNSFGEFYLIERNGNLSIYDNSGRINTMRSIK